MGDRLFVGGVSLKGAVFDTKTGAAYGPDDHLRMAPDWRSNVLLRFTALGAGRYAIALRDGMRALVDVETGVTRVLLGPEALVGEGAAISDDGRRLVTRGLRGNGAKIWDVEAGRILYELPDTGRLEAVFDDTGRRLVTVSEDQITRVWEVDRLPPPAVPAMLAPMQ